MNLSRQALPLAVLLAACAEGTIAPDAPPPNQPPVLVRGLAAQTLRLGGRTDVDLTGAFHDPDGDTLAYAAASSDRLVVSVGLLPGPRLELFARSALGDATVTVVARDPGGLEARAVFPVSVTESPDRAALVALYEATGGPEWESATNWLTDAPLSEWYGVEVNDEVRVTGLGLANNNLNGPIPPKLGNLAALEALDLSDNDLTGPIPPELGNLAGLSALYLWGNQLTGPIPPQLGGLTNLRTLDLRSNELAGAIPPELINLTDLERLHLRYAGIAGELCVPSHAGLVSWLGNFSMAPGAPALATFIPCERTAPSPTPGPSVRVLYAIPVDREFSREYSNGIKRAVELLQWWFADRLGGSTFAIHEPEPQVCQMSEPESFYVKDAWRRVLEGVKHCGPVGYAGERFTWIVYADVWDPVPLEVFLQSGRDDCPTGQLGRGALGITMMGATDLYGLITPRFEPCGFTAGIDRWIGGAGHEFGHALGLPHPPGCDEGLPTCDWRALTYLGFYDWPHTHLRDDEKTVLLASPFIR